MLTFLSSWGPSVRPTNPFNLPTSIPMHRMTRDWGVHHRSFWRRREGEQPKADRANPHRTGRKGRDAIFGVNARNNFDRLSDRPECMYLCSCAQSNRLLLSGVESHCWLESHVYKQTSYQTRTTHGKWVQNATPNRIKDSSQLCANTPQVPPPPHPSFSMPSSSRTTTPQTNASTQTPPPTTKSSAPPLPEMESIDELFAKDPFIANRRKVTDELLGNMEYTLKNRQDYKGEPRCSCLPSVC